MVRYFINRPVAVIAIFLSILAVGIYGWIKIPVSLMPNVAAPEISIEVRSFGISPQAMELSALRPIRQSMVGSFGLKTLQSEAVQNFGKVKLSYEFGTNMDLALIEVNEKIDRIMSVLPTEMERPIVKNNKPSDIPIIRIHLTSDVQSISDLSQLAQYEISKRFEQLQGVSKIESNGTVQKSISLEPNMQKLIAARLGLNEIESLIKKANLPIQQILVRDGNYEYLVEIENLIHNVASLRRLIVTTQYGQQIELGDLFEIKEYYLNPSNSHYYNDRRGIVLAIYPQPEADILKLQKQIINVLEELRSNFPTITLDHSQDQAKLLEENINQLYVTSALAIFFAFVVFFISSKSKRLPFILGAIVPTSILIAIGILWMSGLTLNIITLSGFILGIGLLVDNVIILIEEIGQNRKRGHSITVACIESTSSIFPALLSSSLTTICVFIPLLTLNGISSELFKEQAFALIIILSVSLVLTFVLIPTFYKLWIVKIDSDYSWIRYIKDLGKQRSRVLSSIAVMLIVCFGGYSFFRLNLEELPTYESNSYQIKIRWNEPLSLSENYNRITKLTNGLNGDPITIDLGVSGITQNDINFFDEANIYVRVNGNQDRESGRQAVLEKFRFSFPQATISVLKSINPFEMIFYNDLAPAETKIRKTNGAFFEDKDLESLKNYAVNSSIDFDLNQSVILKLRKDRLLNSNIPFPEIVSHLKYITNEKIITSIKQTDQSIPVSILNNNPTYFFKEDSLYYDLSIFYESRDTIAARNIKADLSGPYISVISNNLDSAVSIGKRAAKESGWLYDLDGELIREEESLQNLLYGAMLGVVLLYLVLSAQFESFLQPLIIFSVIPLSVFASFVGLFLIGSTINIMSIIGVVVMLGIIVNDGILKIDAINRNIKNGLNKSDAIEKAKDERIKPIFMTSLSTIMALLPVLFSSGISSDLQRPLAVVVIFGLIVGTWSSIALLPRIYTILTPYDATPASR